MNLHHLPCLLVFWGLAAQAQEGRDPTVPPPAALRSSHAASAASSSAPLPSLEREGVTVLLRDHKPYLLVGSRWYAVGDTIGAVRVERITETEVWLHDGSALHKVPRFAGVERSVP